VSATPPAPPLFPARGYRPPPGARPFFVAVLHANRPDLTRRAWCSVAPLWRHAFVLDNGDEPLRRWERGAVVRPTFPLTFSQSMELLRRHALRWGYPWYAVMHNDAAVLSPDALPLWADTRARNFAAPDGPAATLTNYDSLIAFCTARVAPHAWDTNVPQYGAETDYYRRLQLAGLALEPSDLPVAHAVSQTIKSDPARHFAHNMLNGHMQNYYTQKWGGPPHRERYKRPWNGAAQEATQ
jgi:hypothetical protein